jgi:hypothetical protein
MHRGGGATPRNTVPSTHQGGVHEVVGLQEVGVPLALELVGHELRDAPALTGSPVRVVDGLHDSSAQHGHDKGRAVTGVSGAAAQWQQPGVHAQR